jgi:hypothetical protein
VYSDFLELGNSNSTAHTIQQKLPRLSPDDNKMALSSNGRGNSANATVAQRYVFHPPHTARD